jgi:diadenylate cyclase
VTDVASILSRLNWISLLDILIVALIFYWLFRLIQGTHAVPLLRGLVVVVVVTVVITSVFELTAFSWLTRNSLPALLVAIPVVFQPELRRLLERLGRTTGGFGLLRPTEANMVQTVQTIASACTQLSMARHGALIVLEREDQLQDIIEMGVPIDGEVSRELLLTLFFPMTALHDGAVIIRGNRIAAASCVLPLSTTSQGDHNLGTRHRAALGVTEVSDAITIVVSEETGIISITHGGRIIRRLDEERVVRVVTAFFRPQFEDTWGKWLARLRRIGGRG